MVTLEDAVEAYLVHCEDDRHLLGATLAAYRSDLSQFVRFASENLGLTNASDLTPPVMRLYGDAVAGRKESTRTRKLRVLALFLRYLKHHRIIDFTPDPDESLPTAAREPQFASPSTVASMLRTAWRRCTIGQTAAQTFAAYRDRAYLELLACAGPLPAEMEALKDADTAADKTALITVRGLRPRSFFIDQPRAVRSIGEYKRLRGLSWPGDAPFFLTSNGKPLQGHTQRAILIKLSGGAVVSPMAVRNALGRELLVLGKDPTSVQCLLGHESLTTTLGLLPDDAEPGPMVASITHTLGQSEKQKCDRRPPPGGRDSNTH